MLFCAVCWARHGHCCAACLTARAVTWQVTRDIVLADPQLLTCNNWEATLTRLDRTGVVMLLPPDGLPAPPLPHEAVKRASLNVLKRAKSTGRGSPKRVMEPRRAAKTVKGAAAVAEAVARAERGMERSAAPKQQPGR